KRNANAFIGNVGAEGAKEQYHGTQEGWRFVSQRSRFRVQAPWREEVRRRSRSRRKHHRASTWHQVACRRQCGHGQGPYAFCPRSWCGVVCEESQRPNLRVGKSDDQGRGVAGSALKHRLPISGTGVWQRQKRIKGDGAALSLFSCLEEF